MNRNDKNKKYTALNINNVFKGKSIEPQNKSYRLTGMQNIGKVSSMRRVPPPKWVPSLKAESGVDRSQTMNSGTGSTWPNQNTDAQDENSKNVASNKTVGDKSQWTSKAANKPFFLIGQEFPSLHSEGSQESSQDSKDKDNLKLKEGDKSKIDDIKNRDANISLSTLHRIDALSISKNYKGDIAATGWAAEDDEPNFDEKIMFSDDESLNEVHNWHSDNDEVVKLPEPIIQNREKTDAHPPMDLAWQDGSINVRYPQYPQMQLPLNVQNSFMTNQFQPNIINRNSTSPGNNICDDPNIYNNSVAEKRNARNIEYLMAIERARQKKLGTQQNRGFGGTINEEQIQQERISNRSRLTSIASDTTESMNTPIETGPPGGPPLLHHMPKQHIQHQIQPMLTTNQILLQSQLAGPSSVLRFQQPFMMPIPTAVPVEQMNDPKLLEKWVEFLKQNTPEINMESNALNDQMSNVQIHKKETNQYITDQTVSNKEFSNQVPEKELKICEKGSDSIKEDPHIDLTKENRSWYEDENSKSENKKLNKPKIYKDYRSSKPNYKDYPENEFNYFECEDDNVAYKDYNLYKQHYSHDRGRRTYRKNQYSYYNDYPQSDYYYKSNSLKLKSKSKEPNSYSESTTDKDHKPQGETQIIKSTELDPHEQANDRRNNNRNDFKKSVNPSSKSAYPNKRYDNRNHKERSNENQQEYSMGFAVNPKERSYYSNNYKNQRYYQSNYAYYDYPSGSKYNNYDDYYYDYNYYDKDSAQLPPSTSGQVQYQSKLKRTNNRNENWRQRDDRTNTRSKYDNQGKPNRNNRKTDKRQTTNTSYGGTKNTPGCLKYASKDGVNDNDVDEWETASEGGSVKSSSVSRDIQKTNQKHSTNAKDKMDNRKVNNKMSGQSCNSGNDITFKPDDDDNHGGSNDKNLNNRSTYDSETSNKTSEIKSGNGNNDNSNKEHKSRTCSNNNNTNTAVNKNRFTDFIEMTNIAVVNVDKLPEVTEDEELLYDNTEQFQEVLSKATKKTRKLEEMKRQKEISEQKHRESLIKKSKWDNSNRSKRKDIKEPTVKPEVSRETRRVHTNPIIQEKEAHSSTPYRSWGNSKVSMSIGSWDNKLAENIEKRVPPKPIGTPAVDISWNQKTKSVTETKENRIKSHTSDTAKSTYQVTSNNSEMNFGSTISFSINNNMFVSDTEKTEKPVDHVSSERKLREAIDFDYDVNSHNCDKNCVIKSTSTNQTLDDKINSVKTIWENQKDSIGLSVSSTADNVVPVTTSSNSVCVTQDNSLGTSTIPIPNVCKVKPQLQQDLSKKDTQELSIVSNSLNAHNYVANYLPYSNVHDYQIEHLTQNPEAYASILNGNQPGLPINYNITNSLVDANLLRQNSQDQMISNKLNFLNQNPSSFYPPQVTTPKMNNTAQIAPSVNMDMSPASSHAMQQLLLSRQNSLSSMMQQSNPMHLSFLQSNQQPVQAQTSLFPSTGHAILGPTPFSQTPHYHPSTGGPNNFAPHPQQMHHTHTPGSFHPNVTNQQILLNQQGTAPQPGPPGPPILSSHPLTHERVINSAATAFTPFINSTDINNVQDFSDHKSISHHNNIVTNLNGPAFMLQHNLNILMKPQMFQSNSQYNNYTASIQSNQSAFKANYDNGNVKSSGPHRDLDIFSSERPLSEINSGYIADNYRNIATINNVNNINNTKINVSTTKMSDDYPLSVSYGNNKIDLPNTNNWSANNQLPNKCELLSAMKQYGGPSNVVPVMSGLDRNITFSPRSIHSIVNTDASISTNNNNSHHLAQKIQLSQNNQRNYLSNYRDISYNVSPNVNIPNSNLVYQPTSNMHSIHSGVTANNYNLNRNKPSQLPDNLPVVNPVVNKHSSLMSNNHQNHSTNIAFQSTPKPYNYLSKPTESYDTKRNYKNCNKGTIESDYHSKLSSQKELSCNHESKKVDKSKGTSDENFEQESWSKIQDDKNESDLTNQHNDNSQQRRSDDDRETNSNNLTNSKFGYEETRLSSKAAQSLANCDPTQLKNVIMRLRQGPVMTDSTDFNSSQKNSNFTDLNHNQSLNSYDNKEPSVTLGFFSPHQSVSQQTQSQHHSLSHIHRNRPLTPPLNSNMHHVQQNNFRHYIMPNNTNNYNSINNTMYYNRHNRINNNKTISSRTNSHSISSSNNSYSSSTKTTTANNASQNSISISTNHTVPNSSSKDNQNYHNDEDIENDGNSLSDSGEKFISTEDTLKNKIIGKSKALDICDSTLIVDNVL